MLAERGNHVHFGIVLLLEQLIEHFREPAGAGVHPRNIGRQQQHPFRMRAKPMPACATVSCIKCSSRFQPISSARSAIQGMGISFWMFAWRICRRLFMCVVLGGARVVEYSEEIPTMQPSPSSCPRRRTTAPPRVRRSRGCGQGSSPRGKFIGKARLSHGKLAESLGISRYETERFAQAALTSARIF